MTPLAVGLERRSSLQCRGVTLRHSLDLERQRFGSEIMTHLDHLYRVAYYLVKNDVDAQDCVQETCARALSSRDQFTPGTNMKAWLTKILYNFFYDFYTRNRRTIAAEDLSLSAGGDFWETLPTQSADPETQVLAQELAVKVDDALKQIPTEFRAPIVLVDMGDFTYAEAAEILSCPIGTVRSRLSRGRKLLHRILGRDVL
jgi:RNA polymerase sigma-70 factor (ECF subfamily)